jgi:aminoglycoside phosphotransferase (APT) family kinase protein/RimJ/RimL family protein N-acetyltransferase
MDEATMSNHRISFKPLSEEYFALIQIWFNEPHVQSFYSLRAWTIEDVRQKLTPCIQGVGGMECYIISVDKTPMGYIQCYPVKEHPWDNQNLVEELIQNSAGIDLFIGEKKFIGKGFGCEILEAFLKNYIWTRYKYCLVDPDIRNDISIRLFKKCGFRKHEQISSKDALNHPATLQLFIKERPDKGSDESVGIDLEVYKKQFALQSATFTHINHTDTIIAEVYKVVASDDKSFILKICPRIDDYLREVYFLRQLKGCIPIPQIIATIEPSRSHFGAVLMEYVNGELLKDEDWSNDLAFELGIALAHLHNNQTDRYGDLTKPKTLVREPNLYFKDKFQEELDECKKHLPENLIEKCHAYLDACQSLLANVDGPCLVHRDFRPGNMIIWQGRLQGIIDWASARSGFAEQDFCSIEHFKWAPHSKYKKTLLDGYSSIRPVPNYQSIMPLLQLGRALAVIGYTVQSNTWNNRNSSLYTFNRKFLDSFNFFANSIQ